MEAAPEEKGSAVVTMVDEKYEFSAPRWFDFVRGETEEEKRRAELWFDSALSHGPSPFMPRIKARRSFKVENLCNFNEEAEKMQKAAELSDSTDSDIPSQSAPTCTETKEELNPAEGKGENKEGLVKVIDSEDAPCTKENKNAAQVQENERTPVEYSSEPNDDKENIPPMETDCTPKPLMASHKGEFIESKKKLTARKIASMLRNPSVLKPKNPRQPSQAKGIKPASAKRETKVKSTLGTPNLAQENQAIKRQKLEGGRSRQILNVKPTNLLHKTKQGLVSSSTNLCPSTIKETEKENRKFYVREQPAPFVSMAEMMKKFQSSTRDLSLPVTNSSLSQDGAAYLLQNKSKLTLTRPKEPEFETSQRVRPVRVKSLAELEEEMMAKIPKFKARPLNRKILEATTLPARQRSIPQPPEFQEFHLETMTRANQHTETSSITSTEVSRRQNEWRAHLTEPKCPVLHTMLRARPPKLKSSKEMEQEELEKAPKFKARPLNKKIFESKGELGIFCNTKKHITIPQEFHFATNERIPQPSSVADLFDKLSLNSASRHDPLPRNTTPNPFHLRTEERGAEKEKKFVMEVLHKQLEEEQATVPKANPYPYTTDYPVIPPKPAPKQSTKPEPFQLESLVRHEEEMLKEMEERMRMEREEAQRRIFRAQPILKEDPIPVPEQMRRPLTEIQGFNLHVEHRAVEREEFDQRIKEKEMLYKRYREESEAARMLEEEKALKQLRRTMVPHARPVPRFDNPFCPQKSLKEATKPKSPTLRVLKRRGRRNMARPMTATSSAAALMR